jgi:hypothetical protein
MLNKEGSGVARSIVIAGLLGGLLGGVVSFAMSRVIKPAEPVRPEPLASPARELVEAYISKLRAGKNDEFVIDVRTGMALITEQEFATFKQEFTDSRNRFVSMFGSRTGEYELVRDSVISPSLARVIFLEKYERGGVLWFFVVYLCKDGWRLAGVSWNEKLALAAVGVP